MMMGITQLCTELVIKWCKYSLALDYCDDV